MRKLTIINDSGIAVEMKVVIDRKIMGSIAGCFLITFFGKKQDFNLDEKEHIVSCFYNFIDPSDGVNATDDIIIPSGNEDYQYYVVKKMDYISGRPKLKLVKNKG